MKWSNNSFHQPDQTQPKRFAWRSSVARMVTHLCRGRAVGQKQRQGGTSGGVRQMDEWALTLAELLIAKAFSVRALVSFCPSLHLCQ